MKTLFFWMAIVSVALTSIIGYSKNMNLERTTTIENQTQFSTGEIVSSYLKIKNALVKSDSKSAAQAAKELEATLSTGDLSQLTAVQKVVMITIIEGAMKEAKNIASNSGKLDKQRKAFQILSSNVNDFVSLHGTPQKLYVDFCPMYQDGSIWLSEAKDIKNPYYGAQMLTCGKIKETFE